MDSAPGGIWSGVWQLEQFTSIYMVAAKLEFGEKGRSRMGMQLNLWILVIVQREM